MGVSAAWAAVAATATSAYVANENGKRQESAAQNSAKQAAANADASDQANNKANQKRTDSSALLSSNQQAGKGGTNSTMLTGAAGVAPGSLQLGKTTLLGG